MELWNSLSTAALIYSYFFQYLFPNIHRIKHGLKKIPKVHHFKIFGCLAHAKNIYAHLPKLADISVKTIMLEYEDGTKPYRLLDPQNNRIMVSMDVLFEEEKKWCLEEIKNGDDEQRGTFTVQISEKHSRIEERNIEQIEVDPNERQRENSSSTLWMPDNTSNASSSSSSIPKKFRSLKDIYTELNEAVGLCFLSIEKPTSYEEAAKNEN